MVKVTVWRRKTLRSLHLEGHAGYHPGNDIVCAGCSAIVYALMGWISNAAGHMAEVDELYEKSGTVRITADGDEQYGAAFDMAVIGLMQIAKKYPDHVSVELK